MDPRIGVPKVPMIGKTFTELTVIELDPVRIGTNFSYICQCSCGNYRSVRGDYLRSGYTKRCADCAKRFRIEKATPEYLRALELHGRTFFVWKQMVARCKYERYKSYAGRGIGIDDPRWFLYENFKADMGEAPDGLQIDRIDNNKGYCKANCRWTTPKVNSNNKRPMPKGYKWYANKTHDEDQESSQTNEEEQSWKENLSATLSA